MSTSLLPKPIYALELASTLAISSNTRPQHLCPLNMDHPHLPAISCGTNHVVTVGSMQNLLLWGKNDNQQLGFVVEIPVLTDPTFFQIKHDFYNMSPVQVSCGPNFTAILGLARLYIHKDGRPESIAPPSDDLAFRNSVDAQTLIGELKKRTVSILKVFKKKVVKFKSFVFVVTDLLGLDWDDERIKQVIKAIGIVQQASDLELTRLYERVLGREEGRGIIYLFNHFSSDVPLPSFITPIKNEQREYFKLETPTTPIKVLAGAHYITYLDADNFMTELDFNHLEAEFVHISLPKDCQVLDFCVSAEQRFVLAKDKTIFGWGQGYIDGERSATDVKNPILLRIYNATGIFSGENFNVATSESTEGKQVLIWGNFTNKNMFLDDTMVNRERPIPLEKADIIDVCIQDRSILLLSEDGSVYLFGRYGEIPTHKAMQPIAVPGKYHYVDDIKVTQIASNRDGLFLALTQNGSLFTWTFDPMLVAYLGRKHSKTQPWREPCELQKYEYQFFHKKDVSMPGTEDTSYQITRVRCAYSNTVVLTNTKEVFITGSNFHGQLGQVALIEESDGEEPEEEEPQEGAEAAAEDSKDYEDMEDAYSTRDATAFQPIPKFSGKSKIRISKLACGAFHFLALDETYNSLFAWGLNVHGQLGLKHLAPKVRLPQQITDENITKNRVISLACGDSHSLVLTSAGVFAFGNAERGRLGIGRTNSIDLMHTPVRIHFESDDPEDRGQEVTIKKIAAGQSHSLALSQKGKVYTWVRTMQGSYWRGKLGHGTKEDVYKPKFLWKLSSEITRIACGWNHSAVVDAGGRVWMWGEKEAIDLEADAYEPVIYAEAGNTIHKIKAGNCYTLAVSKENRLFGWGINDSDRLTSEANANFTKKVVIRDQEINKRFKTAACGYNHSAALIKDDGILVVWGSKYNGKLGIPMLDDQGNIAAGETQGEPLRVEIRLRRDKDLEENSEEEKEPQESTPKPADIPAPDASAQPPADTTLLPASPSATMTIIKRKPLSMKTKCELSKLQSKLKGEEEISQPEVLVAMDVQLRNQMIKVYESFSRMSDVSQDKSFVETLVSKTLVRIQNQPFKMKLESQPSLKAHIRNVKFTYKAIISTLQLHPCYLFNIIKAKYENFYMNQRILRLVFQGIDGDDRLMHSALRCARLILDYEMAAAATAVDFINNENTLYLTLVQIIIGCKISDIESVMFITKQIHSTMVAVVGDDVNGLQMPKDMQSMAKDKRRADGRKNNLMEILSKMTKQLEAWVFKGGIKFSDEIRWMLYELRSKFALKIGHSNVLTHNELNADYFALIKFVLAQTFAHICRAVEKPTKYFITFESDQTLHQENLTTLSRALSCYFQVKKFDDMPYLETINAVMTKPLTDTDPRYIIFEALTANPKFAATAKMTETIFAHSYRNFDVTVTASVEVLAYIHKTIHTNIDQIALSRNTYDAMRSIDKFANPPIDPSEDDKLINVNLRLRTRTVRFQQSLVICNECEMAVAKELASPRFESLMSAYEPLPEDSLQKLIAYILVAGPTAQVKKSLAEYLLYYETSTAATRSKAETDRLYQARDLVNQAAEIHFASEELRPTPEVIDDFKAKFLAKIQDEVTDEYYKRKTHTKLIELYVQMLDELSILAGKSVEEENQLVVKKRDVLYNVEYGASNREVEQYSDSYVYKIFLNEITKYTTSQPMSQDLFETLREEDIKHIKAYGRATYARLKKQKILLEFEPLEDLE